MANLKYQDLFKETPPKLGREVLKYYAFDPEYINLNNGSYGSTPTPVLHLSLRLTHTPRGWTGRNSISLSSGNVKSFHPFVCLLPYYDCTGNGTIDYAPFLSVVPALDFRNWLGGEHKINEYCHGLALKGGKRLAEIFGTRVMDPEGDLTLNMVNVELPFPSSVKPTEEIDLKFKEKLLRKYKVYSAHFYHNGCWWTRCSTQIWNELDDFEKLGKAWLSVCAETMKELVLKAD